LVRAWTIGGRGAPWVGRTEAGVGDGSNVAITKVTPGASRRLIIF